MWYYCDPIVTPLADKFRQVKHIIRDSNDVFCKPGGHSNPENGSGVMPKVPLGFELSWIDLGLSGIVLDLLGLSRIVYLVEAD